MFKIQKNLFLTIKGKFLKALKIAFSMLLVKKCQFFLYVVLVTTSLELRVNNVLERKETFLSTKTKFFKVPKVAFFQRG